MRFFAHLEKSKDCWFLLGTSCVFFLLRLPSLFEPYWYGDEGIYQTIGTAINAGRLLYQDIWDNKPPLLYLLYALFNGDQFSLRFLSLIFGLLSTIVFFFLAKKLLFLNTKSSSISKLPIYIATALFTYLFALPLFEGNIANAENFMLLPILTAGLLATRYVTKPRQKTLIYIGLLLSFAFLLKIVAIFDLAAFGLFLFFANYTSFKKVFRELIRLIPLVYGFLVPLLIMFVVFFIQGGMQPFINAVFQQNIGYVEYGNTFIVPQGLLYLKLFLLLIGVIFLFSKKNSIGHGSVFIYLWLLFSLFNSFFSQRPYTHYILVLLPSFCLFTMLFITDIQEYFRQRIKKIYPLQFVHGVIFLSIIFLVFHNFDIYKKNLAYYQNFLSFMMNTKDLDAYQRFFDSDMPRAYQVAQFLKAHTKKNDIVFVWGNPGQIYKMSETLPPGKYTVAYHITHSRDSLLETAKAIAIKKPRFIVLASSQTYPFDLSTYRYVYSIQGAAIYESLF